MAGSLNRVQLIGNVGKTPEIKSLNSGSRVANLSLATSENWKDKQSGEKKERTEWHNIVVWNDGLIGVIERYVTKGSKLFVEGQLQTRKYEKDGSDRYSTEVVLQGFGGQIILLGDAGGRSGGGDRGSDGGGHQRQEPARGGYGAGRAGGGAFDDDLDDDVPFATNSPHAREPGTSRRTI